VVHPFSHRISLIKATGRGCRWCAGRGRRGFGREVTVIDDGLSRRWCVTGQSCRSGGRCVRGGGSGSGSREVRGTRRVARERYPWFERGRGFERHVGAL